MLLEEALRRLEAFLVGALVSSLEEEISFWGSDQAAAARKHADLPDCAHGLFYLLLVFLLELRGFGGVGFDSLLRVLELPQAAQFCINEYFALGLWERVCRFLENRHKVWRCVFLGRGVAWRRVGDRIIFNLGCTLCGGHGVFSF